MAKIHFIVLGALLCAGCSEEEQVVEHHNLTSPVNRGIFVAPNPLAFRDKELGTSQRITFQVYNTSDDTLLVERVELLEGTQDDASEIKPGDPWFTSFELAPNAQQQLSLIWEPVNLTADSAKLRFTVINAANAASGVLEVNVTTPYQLEYIEP